jgi:formiminoglutamase
MNAWPNLSELLVDEGETIPIGLVGAPLAAGSVTPGACDRAPKLLRRTLKRIGRYDVETGRELSTLVRDRGDVELAGLSIEQATGPIRDAVAASAAEHPLTLSSAATTRSPAPPCRRLECLSTRSG